MLPSTSKRKLYSISIFILLTAIQFTTVTAQETVINGGWYFDSINGQMVGNSGIVVISGKFFDVGTDLSGRDLTNANVINLSDDDYILPGIFDLHAHYNVDLLGKGRRDEYDVNPVIFLANGVTSTFPGGEFNPYEMLDARKKIDRGEKTGPRIFNSGPYFGPARAGWNRNATKEDIYREVDYWAEKGAGGFKAKRISPEHLKALVERAHAHGLTVTGHLDSGYRNTINPKAAILLGIDRIEHFLGGDAIDPTRSAYSTLVDFKPGTPEFDDIVSHYLKYNVYFDATITAYGYYGDRKQGFDYWVDETKFFTPYVKEILVKKPERRVNQQFKKIFEVKQKTIKAFYEAGAGHLITLGTDHPSTGEYIAGFSSHRELEAFVFSGIPAKAALQFATINGAKALNVSNRFGSIEPGKFADLFVIKGNPLEDISNTRNVQWVMKSGKIYNSAELLKSVEGKMGPTDAEDAEKWHK